MKKFLSLFLSLLMILSVWSVSASAADCKHDEILGGIIEVQPTCNSTGVRKVYCGICQKYVYVSVPTVEHTWVWTIRPGYEPTVHTTGIKDGVCSVCGRTQNGVTVPKLECSVHGAADWESKVSWTVTVESTCTSTGKKQAWCEGCKLYINREIPKKAHNTVVYPREEATCESNGHTESLYCRSCRSYIEYHSILPATGHNLVLRHGMYDVDPTCTEKGSATLVCLNGDCEYTETIEVNMLPHADSDGDYFCDMCEARICKCICHKGNFISNFIRKINTLLNKLLNNGEMIFSCCECMEPLAL